MNTKSMRVTSRLIAVVLLVASGIFTGTSAQAVGLTQADIYNPAKINTIEFTIPSASVSALNNKATAKLYTAASVKVTSGGTSMGPVQIGLRLKGSTSLELLPAPVPPPRRARARSRASSSSIENGFTR